MMKYKLNMQCFGGRGANVSTSTKRSVTPEQKLNALGERMQQLQADFRSSYSREMPRGNQNIQREYLDIQQQYNELRERINARNRKKAESIRSKETKSGSKKTFVNSYGEATQREIKSASYDRAQRRNTKAILRNMGY